MNDITLEELFEQDIDNDITDIVNEYNSLLDYQILDIII